MDTLPLPPRPNLAHYKKRAKDLVKASTSTDGGAIRAWAAEWIDTLARLRGVPAPSFVQGSFDRAIGRIEATVRDKGEGQFTLADAQFLIARAHGFESWMDFASHLERFRRDPKAGAFEAAVDAAVTGDLATLQSLVRRQPQLARARSTRVHRCTLLHYLAANGVEDYRQVTPPNAVTVARFLLEAGAEVDAIADTYGGGTAQTTMNLLVSSAHPAEAGLQPALVEALLDFGAAIDGLADDGSPLMTALAFTYPDAAETLARRGARVDNILAAAALGRADLVSHFIRSDAPKAASPTVYWIPKSSNELALVWACKCGRSEVVELLLRHGVSPAAKDKDDMTALHHAAASRNLEIVMLLLDRGAPLEVKNVWGGTVLDSTVWFAVNAPIRAPVVPPRVDYLTIMDALIDAGADMRAVDYKTGVNEIDELLNRHR